MSFAAIDPSQDEVTRLLNSLLQWLSTFDNINIANSSSIDTQDVSERCRDLADGVLCAKVLNEIAPQFFDEEWMRRIVPAPPHFAWRLRMSNLRQVVQKIRDYTNHISSLQQFALELVLPDVNKIAKDFDNEQITRLLQLILCCAVNCDKKQNYIKRMLDLPEEVQQDIMTAIQELIPGESSSSSNSSPSHATSPSKRLSNNISYNSSNKSQNETLSPQSTPEKGVLKISRPNSSNFSNSASNASSASGFVNGGNENNNGDNKRWINDQEKEKIIRELEIANRSHEEKAQLCHELEQKLLQIQIERDQLLLDNEKLANIKGTGFSGSHSHLTYSKSASRRKSAAAVVSANQDNENSKISTSRFDFENDINVERTSGDLENLGEIDKSLILNNLKMQIQNLEDKLFRTETEKEELRHKADLLQQDMKDLISKQHNLIKVAEQNKLLRDELDEQKHLSEKVEKYEMKIESYNRKISELKRELKTQDEKIAQYVKRNVELEEEIERLQKVNVQLDKYKKQLQEWQLKCSQESHRADKVEFELARLSEKFSNLRAENEQLVKTTNQLRSLKQQPVQGILNDEVSTSMTKSTNVDDDGDFASHLGDVLAKENLNSNLNEFEASSSHDKLTNSDDKDIIMKRDIKERIIRLEHENELLHKKLEQDTDKNNSVLESLLEAANLRCQQLESENRTLKRQYFVLESKLKEITTQASGSSPNSNLNPVTFPGPSIEADNHHYSLYAKIEELRTLLARKEQELAEAEHRYKRNLNKAKQAFKALEPLQSITGSLTCSSSGVGSSGQVATVTSGQATTGEKHAVPSFLQSSAASSTSTSITSSMHDECNALRQQLYERQRRIVELERDFSEFKKFKEIHERLIITAFYGLSSSKQRMAASRRLGDPSIHGSNSPHNSFHSRNT